LGYDFYVDRYELSVGGDGQGTQVSGVTPKVMITQADAEAFCEDMSETLDGTMYVKRLLRRAEQAVAAAWPSTLTNADRENRETGAIANACVNTETTVQNTGSRSLCVSRYGIHDIVGNAWEWASDRTNSGTIVATSLDPENTGPLGTVVSGPTRGAYTSLQCFMPAMGMATIASGSVCRYDGISVATFGTTRLTGDYFFPPPSGGGAGVRGGGGVGYSGDPYGGKSGRWTVDWYTTVQTSNLYTGARCGFSVSP
jgi:hypothetical protein